MNLIPDQRDPGSARPFDVGTPHAGFRCCGLGLLSLFALKEGLPLVPYLRVTFYERLCSVSDATAARPYLIAETTGAWTIWLSTHHAGLEIEKDGARMKALIVEDDFTNRILLQAFLSRYGECHLAVNGEEALLAVELATVQHLPYDLICMDMLMPGMNGKEVVKRLRDLELSRGILSNHGVKIIMTTAVRDMKDVFESFQLLCDAYIFKPIDTGQLLEHLQAFHLVA